MPTHDGVVLAADAQAHVLVGNQLQHRGQHAGVVDVFGVGRHRHGQGLLLGARALVALVEDGLELGVVLEHAGVKVAGQGHAVFLEHGGGGFDEGAGLAVEHGGFLLKMHLSYILKITGSNKTPATLRALPTQGFYASLITHSGLYLRYSKYPRRHDHPTRHRGPAARCPIDHAALMGQRPATGCPVSPAAAAFDPFSDGYQQDPPEYLRWAREQEPVFFSPQLGYWVVTRYDDIKAVFRDNLTFSPSIALEKITPTGDAANAVLAQYGYAMNRTLVNEDEPAHMARRRVLMEPFTPEALKHHEPLVRRVTREYIDRFINDGRADLVDQMLWEVPLTIALHFLGVPEEDMDQLRQYSIAHTVNTWGRPRPEEQVKVAHAVGNFWQLAGKILDKMRQDPSGPGWMKYGIRKQAEYPDVVTDSYLHSMMMAGIVAAHETTANATANAL